MGDEGDIFQRPASIQDAVSKPILVQEESFLGGKWMKGKGTFPVLEPATNEVIDNVANVEVQDFKDAVDYAEEEFRPFSKTKEYARPQKLRDCGRSHSKGF
jgi:acyl-CoA reductase-like NAD-dependent aldehyde dehydrogenase